MRGKREGEGEGEGEGEEEGERKGEGEGWACATHSLKMKTQFFLKWSFCIGEQTEPKKRLKRKEKT